MPNQIKRKLFGQTVRWRSLSVLLGRFSAALFKLAHYRMLPPVDPRFRTPLDVEPRQSHGLSRADASSVALAGARDGRVAGRRALFVICRAARLPAGRDGEDHVYPRARGVAVDV